MGERIRPVTPTEIAFEILNSVYNMATPGETANPDEIITARRDFTDGPSIEIRRHRDRLLATVIETYGIARGFGIQRDGLTDISFQEKGRPRVSLHATEFEGEDRARLRDLSLSVVPWIIDRFLNKATKLLPNHIVILFNDFVTLKKRAEAKEILTVVEAMADDFNKRVGGQLMDSVSLADLTMRETMGPMRDYRLSLDGVHKRFLISSITHASRGLRIFGEPEPTVGHIRSRDVRRLEEIRGIGPKKAAFLKRAFAKQS